MSDERTIVAWEMTYYLEVDEDTANDLFDRVLDEVLCDCDGAEDGPPCRAPFGVLKPIYEDDDE